MTHVSEQAPTFALPEAPGAMIDMKDVFGTGTVVLLFFPLAFSPVCTEEFCTIREDYAAWTSLGAKVFGISIDSPFVNAKFREAENLPFPLLSDFNKDVATTYGALHEDLGGMKGVTKRAAFVINRAGAVTYEWISDDPGVQVDFDAIKNAVEACEG